VGYGGLRVCHVPVRLTSIMSCQVRSSRSSTGSASRHARAGP
jgi:hypothetical protein